MRLRNRVIVFMIFPVSMGLLGLYMAHLNQDQRQMSFDKDFMMPFLLAEGMVVVIYIQTNGFKQGRVQPLLHWPKVKRVKKVVHRHRNNSNNGGGEEEEEEPTTSSSDDKKNN